LFFLIWKGTKTPIEIRDLNMKKAKLSNRIGTTVLSGTLLFFMGASVTAFQQPTDKLWTQKTETATPLTQKENQFSKLAESLSPAVVNIRSLQTINRSFYRNTPSQSPGTRNLQPSEQYRQRGEGSGFIIHEDGYILTNAHVVKGSDAVQVALSDGTLFRGVPVGIDSLTDIALIKVDAGYPLPVLPLGSSDALKPGEWVMAIGSPFGLDLTVTAGIVSGKGRSLGTSPFDDFIQTDAPINPGNSGGPLINMRGEAIGINTAILAQGQGLGFSLPIDLVKKLLPQLKEKGRVVRSWLGVTVQDITLDVKESLNLSVDRGSLVKEVMAGSPASLAGIQTNDVITKFDGHAIKSSRDLPKRVAHAPAGKNMSVLLVRDGKQIALEVALKEVRGGLES
jgi:serine protease Do